MEPEHRSRFTPRDAWIVLGGRLALVTLAALAGSAVLASVHGTMHLPPGSMMATWTLLPVNVVTLLIVLRILRRRGVRIHRLLAPERVNPFVELGWALLWLMVLWLPFTGALIGVFALLTPDPFTAMATAFVNEATTVALPAPWAAVVGIIAFVTFAPLNAPVEEFAFRGIARRGLGGAAGIVVPSLAFGLQHAWFAASWQGAAAMFAAFTVWGLGSALIVRWQGRLLPIVIAHVLVNLGTSAPAAILGFTG